MSLIIRPHITEKSIEEAKEMNKYTFVVSPAANKLQAISDVESMYKVEVENVQSLNRLGKTYTHGKYKRKIGRRTTLKLMKFTLKKGDKIDIFLN